MRHAHRFFLSTAAALLLLAATGTAAAQALVRRPYLQTLTPTSVTIVWTTDVATNSRVRYGASPQSLVNVVTLPAAVTQHEVRLANLSPGTRYYYSVGTSAAVLAGGDQTHYFGTAPLPGTATRFRAWLMSDAGTTDPALLGNRDAMLAYVGADRPSLFLTAGDMVHDQGDDQEYTTNFFGVFHSVLRNTVTWPAYGNHEGWYGDSRTQTGAFYRAYVLPTSGEAGGVASGTEAYYSFDHANVHFVVLNSYDIPREPGSAMLDWLESDLASTRQEWLIAYWHYSPYSKGSHDSDTDYAQIEMREYVVPILEGAGVDLVFSGHSHDYERSHLVDGAYDTPTTAAGHVVDDGDGQPLGGGAYLKPAGLSPHAGTVYMVVGHAVWPGPVGLHPLMHVAQSDVGSCLLEVEGNRLSVVNLRSDGVVSDSFTILKGTGGSGGTGGAGGEGGTGGTGGAGGEGGTGGTGEGGTGGTGEGGGGSDGGGNGGGGSGGTGGSGGSGGGIDPCEVEVPVCVTIRRGTLGAVEDATLWQTAPGWNDGASGTLYTGTSSSGFRVSLVWFDLASIPDGSPVCSSTLRLLQGWKTTTSTVRVHEALLPWDEPSVTWGNFNQAWDPAVLGSFLASGPGGERTVDVTEAVEGWVEDGIPNDGFVLEEDPVDRSPFYSSESGTLSRRPALEVCYVP